MDLALSDDQTAILDAIDTLAKPYSAPPTDCRDFILASDDLDRELAEGGFLDVAFDEELGPVTAALIVERLARLPYAVEAAASALVRPLLGEAARPLCLVEAGRMQHPVRFLKEGATILLLHDDRVESLAATEADFAPVEESLYAYPVALLTPGGGMAERAERCDISPAALCARWQIAIAAESAGLLSAAIASTVTYVSERKQFGRPIATFQGVRHRLAEAHVRATGTRWLALKAAHSGDAGDAAIAAHHAQEAVRETVYDLHQFLGAMGMTLEHPLHLWTYRLKLLAADLGGGLVQAADAARQIWGEAEG